jgi:Zn-dependent protease with chaperone function
LTASCAAQSRPALAELTLPPWLWVWLAGYLVPATPGEISAVTGFAWTWPPVVLFSSVFGVLVYAMAAVGVLGVVFPQLRSRWVERRFKLSSDDRPVMTEMQWFVDAHDPSIRLRVSIRADQMARIYPAGWRSARIAVFRPLTVLWHRDRKAAEAILLHEVAHRRQGDHLITGLGSPFVWLIRICVPAYLLFVLIPAVAYPAAGGNRLSAAETVLLIPSVIVLPVIALWLAELSADRQAARAAGIDALQQALQATAGQHASLAARAVTLLSHPPRRLRLRCAAAGSAGTAALMATWPAALAAFALISFGMQVPGPVGSLSPRIYVVYLQMAVTGVVAEGRPVVIASAVVLVAWPALAVPWGRLWSSGPHPGRRQPWWPYLSTASLPAGMLLLASLVPPLPSAQDLVVIALTKGPQRACSTIALWGAGGVTTFVLVEEYYLELLADMHKGAGKTVIAADAQHLDAAVRADVGKPPPGDARPYYIQAVTDFRTAGQKLLGGDSQASRKAVNDADRSYSKANTIIDNCLGFPPSDDIVTFPAALYPK